MQRRRQGDDHRVQLRLVQHFLRATVRLSAARAVYGLGQRVPVGVGNCDEVYVTAPLQQRQMYLARYGAAPGEAHAELLAHQTDSAAGRALGRKVGTASSASTPAAVAAWANPTRTAHA